MKNNYIVNKGYFIKYDLNALLLCFDYFNHGLPLPKYIDFIFTRKILHRVARLLIIVAYFLRLYRFKYKIVTINDNATIILKGIGKWSSEVKLIKKGEKLKVIKKTFDNNIYQKEKEFYQKYKNNSLKIKFPKCIFLKDNIIEMEFLKAKSFQRLIRDGSFNLSTSIAHFNEIKNNLKLLYNQDRTLIHGDLCPGNIFIHNNYYYLIDFTDSHINKYQYDLYVLLEYILSTSSRVAIDKKTLANYSFNNILVRELLEITKGSLITIENQLIKYKEKRFPNRYIY